MGFSGFGSFCRLFTEVLRGCFGLYRGLDNRISCIIGVLGLGQVLSVRTDSESHRGVRADSGDAVFFSSQQRR